MKIQKKFLISQLQKIKNIIIYIFICKELCLLKLNKIEFNETIFNINKNVNINYTFETIQEYVFSATTRDFFSFRYPHLVFSSGYLYYLEKIIPTNMNKCTLYSSIEVNGIIINIKRYSIDALIFLDIILIVLNKIPIESQFHIIEYLCSSKNRRNNLCDLDDLLKYFFFK